MISRLGHRHQIMSIKEIRRKYAEFVNLDAALVESRRWIEVVTGRRLKTGDFREALADGLVLCELLENIGIPVGRVNRTAAAYAGIDNINLFLRGCENLGLKKLHLFDVNDLQDVLSQRQSSVASRAKESQKRLQNVAITIFWLEKVARRQGFRGPVLHQNCFKHLLPEPYSQTRRADGSSKSRESRKRHSVEVNSTNPTSHDHIWSSRRDKIISQLSIQDRREKFKQIEQEAFEEAANLRRDKYTRRKSTGSNFLRKEQKFEEERRKRASSDMSGSRNFYSQSDRHALRESAALQDKMHGGVVSPQPISLGNRANVDLKGKQRFFEEQEPADRSNRTRPKSWGPGEIDKLTKRINKKDASFKDKHLKYEHLQLQADTESATLQGKIHPQLSVDSRDGPSKTKAVLPPRADVQLSDKRNKFEKLDHQAQKDSAVLRGDHRVLATDGRELRRQPSGNADPKLRRKQEMFESLEKQASEDMETLQGKRRLSTSDREHSKRSSGVYFPKDVDVKLGDKKSKFEELDQKAQKESSILRMNQSRSTGDSVREPRSSGTSYSSYEETSSSENVFREMEPVTRHPVHEKTHRPTNYEYQTHPHINDIRNWETTEEPLEITPDTHESHSAYKENNESEIPLQADTERPAPQLSEEAPQQLGRTARFTRERYGNGSFDLEDSTEQHLFGGEHIQPESASVVESEPGRNVQNLSYRDFAQPPPRESREGFASRKQPSFNDAHPKPWREDIDFTGNRGVEEGESLHYGGSSYNDYDPVPKGGQRKKFMRELEGEKRHTEMPWRREVRQLRERPPREEIVTTRKAVEAKSNIGNDDRILSKRDVNPSGSLKRDAYLRELGKEKGVGKMPWRQEVKELKERFPRKEEEEESPEPIFESPDGLDIRKLTYRDFAIAPKKSVKRDTFVREKQQDKDGEEMPWRQEIRELKDRPPTEEEVVKPTTERVTESAYDEGETTFSYRDFVPVKHGNLKRNEFLREAEKQKSTVEMPWRQEVRDLKRSSSTKEDISEDDSIPETIANPNSRKLSYRDFSRPPPNKGRDTFVSKTQRAEEEMPWRTEVRELRNRGPREETLQDEDADNRRSRGRAREYEKSSLLPRSKSSPALDGRKLSYQDFVCPPSTINREPSQQNSEQLSQPKNDDPRKRYKVQDLTKRFTEIEADQLRPKQGGIPSPKSLVNKAELERIEREMKTRTWHGFPAEYADHAERRSSVPDNDEDAFPYRPADISVDNYNEVFEDPENLFVRQESYSVPTELRQEHVDRTVDRATVRPHYDHGEEELVHQRGDSIQWNSERYRTAERGDLHVASEPSRDSETSAYQNQHQPDRDVFQPQTTSALNSMPEPPMERNQWPSTKEKGGNSPRDIYLWSPDNRDPQEPPLQRSDQPDNILNAAPMSTEGNSNEAAEHRKENFEDRARNGRMPLQNSRNEHQNVPKEMPPNRATDLKERPIKIRSNLFVIVGKSNQAPPPDGHHHGPTEDVEIPERVRQMDTGREQGVNKVLEKDAWQAQLAKARVVDINEEQLALTRNGDGGRHAYEREEAWKGTRENTIESEIPKDDENSDSNPETEQVYLKKQLRDADYRAKLRNELLVTNRKQREGAQYLLSQMKASHSSDGEEEPDKNGEQNNHTNGFDHEDEERYNKPPRKENIRDDNRVIMAEKEERYWKEKREHEKELAQRGRHADVNYMQYRVERFNGYSESHSRNTKEDELMAQQTERLIRERQPQKPQNEVVELRIAPTEKPSQTFSLDDELLNMFREDTDEHERLTRMKRGPETYNKFENDRPMDNSGPTLGNEVNANPKSTRDVFNGSNRYDPKKNFDRNGYEGYDYPEPALDIHRNGLKEDKHYKSAVRSQRNSPPRYDGHSMQYTPVEFVPAKISGTLEDGYPKPQTRSKINGTTEDNEQPMVDKRSTKNGPTGYNIYETFIHGKNNHVVCEYCGTTIEKSPSMFVAEVNKYWHLHCFQCVVCQATFNEHSSHSLHITDSRLHCERCFITDDGEKCTEV